MLAMLRLSPYRDDGIPLYSTMLQSHKNLWRYIQAKAKDALMREFCTFTISIIVTKTTQSRVIWFLRFSLPAMFSFISSCLPFHSSFCFLAWRVSNSRIFFSKSALVFDIETYEGVGQYVEAVVCTLQEKRDCGKYAACQGRHDVVRLVGIAKVQYLHELYETTSLDVLCFITRCSVHVEGYVVKVSSIVLPVATVQKHQDEVPFFHF